MATTNMQLLDQNEPEPTSAIQLFRKDLICSNFKIILKFAIPILLCNSVDCVNEMIALHFISLLNNPIYMGAVGLGTMFSSMTITNILYGFGVAYQTYSSQSFGRKDTLMLNIYHYRARFLQCVLIVPFALLSLLSNKIFLAIGIEKELAYYAYLYTLTNIPFAFAIIQYDITRTFLRSQQIVNPVMISSIIVSCLGPLLHYLMIFKFNFGFLGNPLARFMQSLINNIVLVLYITISGCCKESWKLPNKNCFKDFMPLMKMGSASSLMLCFQSWCFQLMHALAGMIGSITLATNVALYNILIFIYRSCWGIAIAAGILVGNSIGSLKISLAKFYLLLAMLLDVGTVIILSTIATIFKQWLSHFYSTTAEVQAMFQKYLYMVFILEIFDTLNATCTNVLSGLGMQRIAIIRNFISYYVVMLPFAYLLGFKLRLELPGILLSITIGSFTQLVLYTIALYRLNWEDIAQKTKLHLEQLKNASAQ